MTYYQDDDYEPKLPPDVLKARVEQMLPWFATAVKEAVKTKAAIAVPYSRITNTATPLEEIDCTITGMLINYARLYGVFLMIVTDEKSGNSPSLLATSSTQQKA